MSYKATGQSLDPFVLELVDRICTNVGLGGVGDLSPCYRHLAYAAVSVAENLVLTYCISQNTNELARQTAQPNKTEGTGKKL